MGVWEREERKTKTEKEINRKVQGVFLALNAQCVSKHIVWPAHNDVRCCKRQMWLQHSKYGLLWLCVSMCLCFIIKTFTDCESRASNSSIIRSKSYSSEKYSNAQRFCISVGDWSWKSQTWATCFALSQEFWLLFIYLLRVYQHNHIIKSTHTR